MNAKSQTNDAAQPTLPNREAIARMLWIKTRHYDPTDHQLAASDSGRECLALADAVLALFAAQPPAAPVETDSEIELVCAEAYQVVGSMLSDLGQFDTDRGQKILDNLSQAKMVHRDVLPWPSFEKPHSCSSAATEDALGYAQRLATILWEKHYKNDAPEWKPLPDLTGVLTQIDNMTAGLLEQIDIDVEGAQQDQAEIKRLGVLVEEANKHLRSIASQCGNVIYNCEQRPADNERHLGSWRSVKEYAEAALSVTSTVRPSIDTLQACTCTRTMIQAAHETGCPLSQSPQMLRRETDQ